jgi:hypothetical protein
MGVVQLAGDETGAANTFVHVVVEGPVTAKVQTGTNHPTTAYMYLEPTFANSPIKLIASGTTSTGLRTKWSCAVCQAVIATTATTAGQVTGAVFFSGALKMANTKGTGSW